MAGSRELVFVDGAAFSGLELVAGLLDSHPGMAAVSVPTPLHSDARGVPALLAGRLGLDDFMDELACDWPNPPDSIAGFRDAYRADPLAACRELFWAFLEDAGAGGSPRVVEASSGNLREAQTLMRLVGDARFLHVVRDGRDVAAAACGESVDTRRMTAALGRWADELREIERGVRGEEDGTRYSLPAERFSLVSLDELAGGGGDAARARLLEWLGVSDDDDTRSFAERELAPGAVGIGLWRERVRGPSRRLFTRRYRRLLAELEREGNHAAPTLIQVHDGAG